MWIFTNNEFLSAVRHRDMPDHLMIRYRNREQAQACTIPGEVTITQMADYIARKTVSETDFTNWMVDKIQELQYDNYKDSTKQTMMHEAPLMDVWQTMHQWQTKEEHGDNAYNNHPSSAFWNDYHIDGDETVFCDDCWTRHKAEEECAPFGDDWDRVEEGETSE